MTVILKEGKDNFRILDPFYTGEWEMDREATVSYLSFLEHLQALSFDDSVRFPNRIKATEMPEPFRTFVNNGLPLSCDFNPEKILSFIDRTDSGIITPPIPIFEVTPLCNYKCPWCYIPRETRRRLSVDVIREKLVVPLFQRGTRLFVLTGGEPSLELPRLREICGLIGEEAEKTGTRAVIALLTNGSGLASNAKIYKKLGISTVQVSVISTYPKRDRQLRHAPEHVNSVDEAFSGTRRAVEEGIAVSFNFVLLPALDGMPSNIHEIPEMVAYAKQLGVYMIRIVPVVPSGEACVHGISLSLDEMRLARELICQEIERSGKDLIVYSPIGYDVPAEKPVYCRAGNDVLYINSEGWVYPCNNLICPEFRCNDVPIGEEDIMHLWDTSPLLKQFRSPAEVCSTCAHCDFRTECGGQCRAQIFWRFRQIHLSRWPEKCYKSKHIHSLKEVIVMKVQTIRENTEPFGTEYSCMMAIIVDGKLVIIRSGTREFEEARKLVLSSDRLSPKGAPKEATGDDLLFFFNQLRNMGPALKA